jgi:hypothetical protein
MAGSVSGRWWAMRRLAVAGAVLVAIAAQQPGAAAADLYGVVTLQGRAQAGTTIELLSDHGRVAEARTTGNGGYRFRDIPPGVYRLRVAGQERTVTVVPGINRLDVGG